MKNITVEVVYFVCFCETNVEQFGSVEKFFVSLRWMEGWVLVNSW